jgi:hypothetical protein
MEGLCEPGADTPESREAPADLDANGRDAAQRRAFCERVKPGLLAQAHFCAAVVDRRCVRASNGLCRQRSAEMLPRRGVQAKDGSRSTHSRAVFVWPELPSRHRHAQTEPHAAIAAARPAQAPTALASCAALAALHFVRASHGQAHRWRSTAPPQTHNVRHERHTTARAMLAEQHKAARRCLSARWMCYSSPARHALVRRSTTGQQRDGSPHGTVVGRAATAKRFSFHAPRCTHRRRPV